MFLAFPREAAFLQWGASAGIVERFGPQMVPAGGPRRRARRPAHPPRRPPRPLASGRSRAAAVRADESRAPAGPRRGAGALHRRRTAASTSGAPPAPVGPRLPAGLDPRRPAAAARGRGRDASASTWRPPGAGRRQGRAGTYLVGIRRLGAGTSAPGCACRSPTWRSPPSRSPSAVRFVVTSLSSGAAGRRRAGAGRGLPCGPAVGLGDPRRGRDRRRRHGALGRSRCAARPIGAVRRIVVEKDGDTLVLDPDRAPDGYADNQWQPDAPDLAAVDPRGARRRPRPRRETLVPPLHRAPGLPPRGDGPHQGLRARARPRAARTPHGQRRPCVVRGPGRPRLALPGRALAERRLLPGVPADDLPTGDLHAPHFETPERRAARRGHLPHGGLPPAAVRGAPARPRPRTRSTASSRSPSPPPTTPAAGSPGGRCAGASPSSPTPGTPKAPGGFLFSSDARFSPARAASRPRRRSSRRTSPTPRAAPRSPLNPGARGHRPAAHLRRRGHRHRRRRPDRHRRAAGRGAAAVRARPQGAALPGQAPRRSSPRCWCSGRTTSRSPGCRSRCGCCTASGTRCCRPATSPTARPATSPTSSTRGRRDHGRRAARRPLTVPLADPDAPASTSSSSRPRDRLGRTQIVAVDLYAGGDEPVSLAEAGHAGLHRRHRQAGLRPGRDRAARARRARSRRRARWSSSRRRRATSTAGSRSTGGAATVEVPVLPTFVPRLPVHVVLMRGRVRRLGAGCRRHRPTSASPTTMAATTWLTGQPGREPRRGDARAPGAGAARAERSRSPSASPTRRASRCPARSTLWLVDAGGAGARARAAPRPAARLHRPPVRSRLAVRDTRNLAFGELPFAELPGRRRGRGGRACSTARPCAATSRRVPYYNPAIAGRTRRRRHGDRGAARQPHDLQAARQGGVAAPSASASAPARSPCGCRSSCSRRCRASCGPATASPPRRSAASSRARAGPGKAEMQVEGVDARGRRQPRPRPGCRTSRERLDFPVTVPTPAFDRGRASSSAQDVTFRVAVERTADGARDAFEVQLPIRADRGAHGRAPHAGARGRQAARRARRCPSRRGPARCGARLAALRPARPGAHGGRARLPARLPLRLHRAAHLAAPAPRWRWRACASCSGRRAARRRCGEAWRDTLELDRRGGRRPGAWWRTGRARPGYVSLTAWTVQFLVEAKEAGYPVDAEAAGPAHRARSSRRCAPTTARFIDGESFAERCWALVALAQAGKAPARLRGGAGAQGAVPRPRGHGGGAARLRPLRRRPAPRPPGRSPQAVGRHRDPAAPGEGDLRRPAGPDRGAQRPASCPPRPAPSPRSPGRWRRATPRARGCRSSSTASSPSAATTAGAPPTPTPRRSWRSPSS